MAIIYQFLFRASYINLGTLNRLAYKGLYTQDTTQNCDVKIRKIPVQIFCTQSTHTESDVIFKIFHDLFLACSHAGLAPLSGKS